MSGHALFSPSSAHRWMECPGSFAFPGNTGDSESSEYADDGTASHEFASQCLKDGVNTDDLIGATVVVNGKRYTMDEERAEFIQVYLDACRQLSFGKLYFVEHWVDTSEWLGEEQGGTADFCVIDEDCVTVVDLKYGMGEKVSAFYMDGDTVRPNHQLAIYAAGLLRDAHLLGFAPKEARLLIVQPRLGHMSEMTFDVIDILAFMQRAKAAVPMATQALIGTPAQAEALMAPGEKTCRWCRGRSDCPKLYAWMRDKVRADFTEDTVVPDPNPPLVGPELSLAIQSVGLVRQWCDAVEAAASSAVSEGRDVIGSDGQPMKFVEGRPGNRKWADPDQAEAALVGQLGDKAYEPRTIITAPAAAKLLDRKKSKALWTDIFLPLITRSAGRPILALGSDPRPAFSGAATAGDFDDQQ